MKRFAATLAVLALAAAPALAAEKTYQVTGPVLSVTDTTITSRRGRRSGRSPARRTRRSRVT